MRTLLLAALFVSAVTPSRDAEACGNYRPEPQVFRLSSHTIFDGARSHRRTFVLVPSQTAPEEGLVWRQMSPHSFDRTEIADGKALANPITFTLVGPAGTKVVAATKQAFLSRPWEMEKGIGALEVPALDGFAIAIEGNHPNAKWTELERVDRARYDGMDENRVRGSDAAIVSFYSKASKKYVTQLRVAGKSHGEWAGHALGAITNEGEMKLVVSDRSGRVSQVYLRNI